MVSASQTRGLLFMFAKNKNNVDWRKRMFSFSLSIVQNAYMYISENFSVVCVLWIWIGEYEMKKKFFVLKSQLAGICNSAISE